MHSVKTPLSLFFMIVLHILGFFYHAQAGPLASVESRATYEALSEKAEEGLKEPVTSLHIYWKNGLHLEGGYEKLKLKIGGSIIVDAGSIGADEALQRAFPDLEGDDIKRDRGGTFKDMDVNSDSSMNNLVLANFVRLALER